MAPDPETQPHAMDWMSLSLSLIGDLPINKTLWLPGSHDAGMDDRPATYSLFFTLRRATQCQIYSIRGQLKLGIRWFDIRPMVDNNGNWYCGHYSLANLGFYGYWAGATGEALADVISDINSFLSEHKELVVLKISHVLSCIDGSKPSLQQQRILVNTLISGLGTYLYQGGNASTSTLRQLIGQKGAVVLHFAGDEEQGVDSSVWNLEPVIQNPAVYKFSTNEQSCTKAIDLIDSVTENILVIAEKYQREQLPCLAQWLEAKGNDMPGMLQMDNIYDSRLLTVCLAATIARAFRLRTDLPSGSLPPPIVIYGGKLMTSSVALPKIYNAAAKNENLLVSNDSMGEDPWKYQRKYCVVFLAQRNPSNELVYRARGAWEGEYLDLTTDITSIMKYGQLLTGGEYRLVYGKLFELIKTKDSWVVDSEILIKYRSPDGLQEKQRRIRPNVEERFSIEILRVEWGGVGTFQWRPQLYEQFYERLDHGGEPLIPSLDMFERKDPAFGVVKRARLFYWDPDRPNTPSYSDGIEYRPWKIPWVGSIKPIQTWLPVMRR